MAYEVSGMRGMYAMVFCGTMTSLFLLQSAEMKLPTAKVRLQAKARSHSCLVARPSISRARKEVGCAKNETPLGGSHADAPRRPHLERQH